MPVRGARRRRSRASSSPTSRSCPTRKIGDTITDDAIARPEPFPGLQGAQADGVRRAVSGGVAIEYAELREALEKLRLNDAAFNFEPETSVALGFGFRCGFLGLLHMEIVQERLEREFNIDLITTAPGVRYRVTTTDGEMVEIDNPAKLPEPAHIEKIEEPVIDATDPHARRSTSAAILKLLRGQARRAEDVRVHRPPTAC